MTNTTPIKQTLDGILKTYLDNIQRGGRDGTSEMEIRFGTARGMKPVSRIEYDDVIKRLMSAGFTLRNSEYHLRIFSEYTDPKTGVTRISNVRAELSGLSTISEYCKSDTLDKIYTDGRVKFIQKSFQRINGDIAEPYDATDYNFKATLSLEKDLTQTTLARSMVTSWKDSKKEFRYLNRHSLVHPDYPFVVDMSIVRQSARKGRNTERSYTFKDAKLQSSQDKYEIEIEVNNYDVGIGTKYNTPLELASVIKKTIMLILSGHQNTNYPVSYPVQKDVLEDYMKLIWGSKYKEGQRVYPKNFLGPSSIALQVSNISEENEDANIPNIRTGYTVTEKADGERKLILISNDGNIYLLDTNMKVQFTGSKTQNKALYNSIIDGEHILHDKEGNFINLYAAFDVYFVNGKDIRTLGFMGAVNDDPTNFRLPLLNDVFQQLKPHGVNAIGTPSPMRFEVKTFYTSTDTQSIFQACSYLMTRIKDGIFEYETDGLIFTPMLTGVGSNKIGETTPPRKITWDLSFKWKPPEFNTIDFMVTFQRGTDGQENIKNLFQTGTGLTTSTQLTQYKTAVLRVGFDEAVHGYTNPCLNVIEDNLPIVGDKDNEEGYRPVQFFPTNPNDDDAGICNLLMMSAPGGTNEVFTENKEVIEDNTIVEFRYNDTKEKKWRWEPLRVRYDKTADLRSGGKNFGNAYHVANSNWHSIHNPVTEEMISTGQNIPDMVSDDDVYYNRVSKSTVTRALRDFHNLYVKKKLILSVSKPGNTLIDYAVGMGGDFTKWISAKLGFVFGIDISRDNIENRMKGACARYLNYKKQFKQMPSALFVAGNSSANIRDMSAIFTEKGKQITNAVFGKGAKNATELGKGVYKHYGIAEQGFDVSSIQFAIHYMFENLTTLNNFARNVSETTKVGGYFIGTCYDGKRVFNMLNGTKQNESIQLKDRDIKMWEVIKRYDRDEFVADSTSVGFAIDVYMESIGKMFREYLVNLDYLDTLMINYGFTLITSEEANVLGLPGGRGTFRDLYAGMEDEIKRNPKMKSDYGTAFDMTDNEKTVSFLNNYFVYKKNYNVDAKNVSMNLMGQTIQEELNEREESDKASKIVESVMKEQAQKKPTKTKKKLTLVDPQEKKPPKPKKKLNVVAESI